MTIAYAHILFVIVPGHSWHSGTVSWMNGWANGSQILVVLSQFLEITFLKGWNLLYFLPYIFLTLLISAIFLYSELG